MLGGVTALQVAGNGTATSAITATLAQINTTLADADGLVYHGDVAYTGPDTLTVATSDDLGHNGAGGAADRHRHARRSSCSRRTPRRSPPPQSVSTNEDTAKTITLSASDADGDALDASRSPSRPSHGLARRDRRR